jgi:prolyl-tRNA synthetase
VSTRLIGGLIMTHSDDDGLIVPPRLAPAHIVIIPITFKADDPEAVRAYCLKLRDDLQEQAYHGRAITVELDDRDVRGGEKVWSWIKKGVPIRLEVGPRDMADDSVFMGRRDRPHKEREGVKRSAFLEGVRGILDEIQTALYQRALTLRQESTQTIDDRAAFDAFFAGGEGAPAPGFALAHWSGNEDVEREVNERLGVTIRCVPLPGEIDGADEPGTCPFTGEPSPQRVVWAKAY